jgi:hypothetical protein
MTLRGRRRRPPTAPARRSPALLGALAIALLAGCGGESADQTETSTEAESPAAVTTAPSRQPPERDREGGERSSGRSAGAGGGERQSPSGGGPTPGAEEAAPGVPVTPGGDNSIQVYGVEGGVSEREQATAATRTYLNARLARQWSRACAQASSGLKQSLGELAGGGGCPAALRALTEGVPESALRRVARVGRILSFRADDEQAFLIFRSGGTVKFMPMDSENGAWKVAAIEPSEFFLGP